jgi:hypothetical protein
VGEEPIRVVAASRVGGRETVPAEVGARVETLCFSRREGTPRLEEDGGGARLVGGLLKSPMEMEPWDGLRLWLGAGCRRVPLSTPPKLEEYWCRFGTEELCPWPSSQFAVLRCWAPATAARGVCVPESPLARWE